ncbi:MAG: hypothetical protein H7296_07635 [Bacteroidia bacterium]|nr:hypothetical protein [Bacteroidia bacterium]
MKYAKKILLLIIVSAFSSAGILCAQIIIQPPILGNDVGQYQILELNLINSSGTEYNASISYEINYGQTGPDKLETSGSTKNFKIPASGLLITVSNIRDLLFPINTMVKPAADFSDFLIKNSKFPDGYYRICVTLYEDITRKELGHVCYEFKIETLTSIFLVSPFNNEGLNSEFQLFSWTALTQLKNPEYELVITEVLTGQSLIQAAKANRVFYSQRSNTNIVQLSFATRTMTNKATYLWYVRIMQDNNEITRSELWSFVYNQPASEPSRQIISKTDFGRTDDQSGNDEKEDDVNTPELKFPKHNSSIRRTDIDTVEFSWKHQRGNIKGAIIYEYKLFQVNESGDKEDSLIYIAKKKEELKLILPKSLKLIDGKRYKWNISATSNRKLKPCKKGCSSASYQFEIGLNRNTLQYYKLMPENKGNYLEVKEELNFTCCKSIDPHDGISMVLYNSQMNEILIIDSINVKDSNEKLVNMGSNRYSLLLKDLKTKEPYMMRVGNKTSFEYLRFAIIEK